ncbi:sensor histidine kinase [Phycicoccus flavus]|uniref:histidine kinase n=1 Tax=Phycicoccus flavus TaxID=2502783 RepID=A0A8T6R8A6_9MICO|nr:histidine kinase [Phycicoccus flavus]NHA68441.1 hypothetical protein [Phycicoccus flavus]
MSVDPHAAEVHEAARAPWWPGVTLAVIVSVVGVFDVALVGVTVGPTTVAEVVVILAVVAAVALMGRHPVVALTISWSCLAGQVAAGGPFLAVQVAVVLVLYGAARWGRPLAVAAAGLSIPLLALVVLRLVSRDDLGGALAQDLLLSLLSDVTTGGLSLRVSAGVVGLLALSSFWLAGLVVRSLTRARRSEAAAREAQVAAEEAAEERRRAAEMATLQEGRARLARDVHDVVGHSLTVILAQAESGRYLRDDPEQVQQVLTTIAGAARSSLVEVKQVLGASADGTPRDSDRLGELVAGVRSAGHVVEVSDHGPPRPLPPDQAVVSSRVLQEMLTNAVRHGDDRGPVRVERWWPTPSAPRHVVLRVTNTVDDDVTDVAEVIDGTSTARTGIPGMSDRLHAAGGALSVDRVVQDGVPCFAATAWIPVGSS